MKPKTLYGIVGGTGFESLLEHPREEKVETPYGDNPKVFLGEIQGLNVVFIPRHGVKHELPPHKINYRANLWALHVKGVERIVATNAVGTINPLFQAGDLVVPHDLIDFTKSRLSTYHEVPPVTHIDFTEPYCREIREALIKAVREVAEKVWEHGVYVCTEGPRYETPAEIKMYRTLGGDLVGMTGCPEAVLARELGICYATLCLVSNLAAGMQERLTTTEVLKVTAGKRRLISEVISRVLERIPQDRRCRCREALIEAGV